MNNNTKLSKALENINKKFGSNTVVTLGSMSSVHENMLSSGILSIDKICGDGHGTIPYGRITEIYGDFSSGKTTLCLQLAAQCQKDGGTVAYLDMEQSLDITYAKNLGVNVDELLFAQPTSGEAALEVVDELAQTGEVNLIVVDSVSSLTPQAELDGEMGDMNIGLLARLMSRACRKLVATLNQKNCAVIFINQIRDKVSTGFSMGPSTDTTGGRALKFFSSIRIELKKTTMIKEGDNVVGNNVKIKTVKNKIVPPQKVVEIPLIYGKGFSPADEVLNLALEYGFVEKSGSWLTTHNGERIQGMAKVRVYYDEHPEAFKELEMMVKNKLQGIEIEQVFEVNPETGEIIE